MSTPEHPIDLFQGWPSLDLLPVSLIQQATLSLLSNPKHASSSLTYGPDPGPGALRNELSRFLSTLYSTPWTDTSRLTISGGASSALASILQVYTDPSYTKNVYMVTPTYFLACRIFEDNGFAGRLRAVPEGEDGIDIDYLEHRLAACESQNGWLDLQPTKRALPSQKHYKSVVYCTPTFSNPSGKVMTKQRREDLVRLARKYDALIISDDVYDFLNWKANGEHRAVMPRLVDIDQHLDGGPASTFGNVVSNGSFSKILGPGMRTGWTESMPQFAAGLAECGLIRSGGSPSQFTACIIAEMLRLGIMQRYLFDDLMHMLGSRYHATMNAVKKFLLPLDITCNVLDQSHTVFPATKLNTPSFGGYYIYLHLPNNLNATSLALQARESQNLIFGCGEKFEVKGDEGNVSCRTGIRICIAWETESRLVEGIQRLAELVKTMQPDLQ